MISTVGFSLLNTINPFDLPITLVDGHSMIGEVKKPMLLIPDKHFIKDAKVGFSEISLGKELTRLSIATHIHEIGHTQTESIKGYAESYLNKEVVSIFLEKLAALELDPTGNLLRLSERNRYKFICESYLVLNNIPLALKMGVNKMLNNVNPFTNYRKYVILTRCEIVGSVCGQKSELLCFTNRMA